MYYDIFFRPHNPVKFSATPAGTNILAAADRLELLDAGAKLSFEPKLRDIGDGTGLVTAEITQFECATLRMDKAEYLHLRDTFHGTLTDILMLDPHDMSMAIGIYRIRLNIQHVATSGEVCLIRITGSMEAAASVIDSTRVEVFEDLASGHAMVMGRVTSPSGSTQMNLVDVVSYTGEAARTDKDGNYMLILPTTGEQAQTLTFTKTGYSFPDLDDLDLHANQVYVIDTIGTLLGPVE